MGYYVTIQKCRLEPNGLKQIPPGAEGGWVLSKGYVEPVDYYFKWKGGDWFEEELVALAKAGVTGEVELIGEEGERWKTTLRLCIPRSPARF